MAKGSEPQLYKKQLQEYTQKYGLPFPEYRTQNEGFQHAPNFRTCILIDGQVYESGGAFSHRKEAELDAARMALERITETLKNVGASTHQDPTYCKLILKEYADKMNLKKPEYTTTPTNEACLGFISSMVFNGQVYTGEVGERKKMAEQLAACAAIQSLLQYDSGVLREIINSKTKVHDHIVKRSKLQIGVKSEASMESSKKAIATFPSTYHIKSQGPSANSSRENRSKREAENSEVSIEPFEKSVVTFPSTSHTKSSGANSSRENRSKRETENSAKKKMF